MVGGEDASHADARAPDAGAIDEAPKDAGAPMDAGTPQDAGALDAMVEPDASTSDDGVEPMMCLAATQSCDQATQCCGELSCDTTSLGKVCCGEEGATCATANGEDCCRDLLCIAGRCGYELENSCGSPCTAAPALTLERQRLMAIGGSFLGICGDANHDYGFHVAPANLPASDYSLEGAVNQPVCQWHAAAIDIGMDWPASRDWLRWLIQQIQSDGITGIAEVIGSYDGQNVRYWSDSSGWGTDGEAYTGTGHDTWTHVAIHRSTTLEDHHILSGWTATSGP